MEITMGFICFYLHTNIPTVSWNAVSDLNKYSISILMSKDIRFNIEYFQVKMLKATFKRNRFCNNNCKYLELINFPFNKWKLNFKIQSRMANGLFTTSVCANVPVNIHPSVKAFVITFTTCCWNLINAQCEWVLRRVVTQGNFIQTECVFCSGFVMLLQTKNAKNALDGTSLMLLI